MAQKKVTRLDFSQANYMPCWNSSPSTSGEVQCNPEAKRQILTKHMYGPGAKRSKAPGERGFTLLWVHISDTVYIFM